MGFHAILVKLKNVVLKVEGSGLQAGVDYMRKMSSPW